MHIATVICHLSMCRWTATMYTRRMPPRSPAAIIRLPRLSLVVGSTDEYKPCTTACTLVAQLLDLSPMQVSASNRDDAQWQSRDPRRTRIASAASPGRPAVRLHVVFARHGTWPFPQRRRARQRIGIAKSGRHPAPSRSSPYYVPALLTFSLSAALHIAHHGQVWQYT